VISKLAPELIDENKQILLKCSSHLFRDPLKLLGLLEEVMNLNATNAGYKELLLKYYGEIRYTNLNYSPDCPLIDPAIHSILTTPSLQKNFILLLRYSLYNLIGQKP
jgi:hypothetical protein